VRIDLAARNWTRVRANGRDDGQTFIGRGPDMRTASVVGTPTVSSVSAGVADLLLMKTSRSAFTDFRRDEYTTLPDTTDRLFATSLTATWQYRDPDIEFGLVWRSVQQTLLESFAQHESASVQHTMYAMGEAVLATAPDVSSIHLVMPNKHHLAVDVSRFGVQNRNEIFVATDEPHGLIEATIAR